MIRKISYLIRFPLDANLKCDVKYLLIKKIYSEIKNLVCLSDKNCNKCSCIDKCIYYKLSGENFKEYPSIVINRDFVENNIYKSNDTIQINFYMVGIASSYDDFIVEYMKYTDYIEGNYFQKYLINNSLINEEIIDYDIVNIKLIRKIEDIFKCIHYYNENYNASITEPIILEEEAGIFKADNNHYAINGCKIKIYGNNYRLKVKNYSSYLLEMGIGKNAILGGGVGNADKNKLKY